MANVRKTKSSPRKKSIATKNVSTFDPRSPISSFRNLWQESWDLFRKTILLYSKLIGVGFVLFFFAGLLTILFSLPLGISFLNASGNIFQDPTAFQIINSILLLLWLAFCGFCAIVYLCVLPIASILILHSPTEKSIWECITQSRKFIVTYILTNVLVAFLIAGGFFFFVLPGLLIGFFFLFVSYEIVLENKQGSVALQKSYQLVKNRFWHILGRYLLIEAVVILSILLVNTLTDQLPFFPLISVVFSFALQWFVQCYLYLVYQQTKVMSKKVDTVFSMRWIWIISLLGWSLVIVSLVAVGDGLLHLLNIPANSLPNIPEGIV